MFQVVIRFSWLFSAHVQPMPASETCVPKSGVAITLTHGAGVVSPSSSTMTYSPRLEIEAAEPLSNASCGPVDAGAAYTARLARRARTASGGSGRFPRWLSCSSMRPPSPSSVTRATEQSRLQHLGLHLVGAAEEDAARLVEHLERVARAHEQPQPLVELRG